MDATPYYAPSYFSPAYFSIANGAASSPSNGVSPYNAPTYFSPSYFYGTPSSTPVKVVPDPKGRDEDAYASLLSLIRATGAFVEATLGTAIQRNQAGADAYPLAIVTPKGWEESDDCDPISIVRRVSFGITIVVKSQDGYPQFNQLDRLSSAILNLVDGSSLDGTCIAPLTRIRAGRFDPTNHFPEQSVELEGEFSSIIDPLANIPATL